MPIPMDKLEVTRLHGPPRCARPGPKREALLGQWQRMVQLEDSRLKASSLRSGENTSENILFFYLKSARKTDEHLGSNLPLHDICNFCLAWNDIWAMTRTRAINFVQTQSRPPKTVD